MKQKYLYNTEIFNNSCEIAFYWAGFIAADGNISSKGDFTLSLKKDDYQHLEKFKISTMSDAPIKILPPKEKVINNIATQTSGTAIIRFRAKMWMESFKNFGIIPNKTKTYSIPKQITMNKYFKHFIRGYFDGDGWFTIKNFSTKQKISFGLCGNFSVLQDIQQHLQKYCQIESLPSIYAQKNIFKCEFQNQHDVNKIVNYLYSDATIYLNRKHSLSKLAAQFDENTIILNFKKEDLENAYNRLKSYKLMALEFNCAKSTIAKYMKKYNLSRT